MRTRELLLEHSCQKAASNADDVKAQKGPLETNLIVLTLPIPRKVRGRASAILTLVARNEITCKRISPKQPQGWRVFFYLFPYIRLRVVLWVLIPSAVLTGAFVFDNCYYSLVPLDLNISLNPHSLPFQNGVPAALYMSWLEFLSRDVAEKRKETHQMPPVLFVRGNQTSVLTYYSWYRDALAVTARAWTPEARLAGGGDDVSRVFLFHRWGLLSFVISTEEVPAGVKSRVFFFSFLSSSCFAFLTHGAHHSCYLTKQRSLIHPSPSEPHGTSRLSLGRHCIPRCFYRAI